MKYDIILCGVGGQGVISASNVLALAAFKQGLDVRKHETRGMAQQGGSVVAQIRIADVIQSPVIPVGGADLILALEPLEALRSLKYLSPDGTLLVNKHPIHALDYPKLDDLLKELNNQGAQLVDAQTLSKTVGGFLMQNSIMLGTASKHLPLEEKNILDAIQETFKKKISENLKAFELGKNIK